MFLQAKIKCERNNTPYRVYINDELISERYFTTAKNWNTNELILETWNTLELEIVDNDDYTVSVENVPGYPKAKIWIDEVKWQEEPYEDK